MNKNQKRFGPVDARLFASTMSAMRELGVCDSPLSVFGDIAIELQQRLQKLSRDCDACEAEMRRRIEAGVLKLLNISHMVRAAQGNVLTQLFTEETHIQLQQALTEIQKHDTHVDSLRDLPLSCKR